MKTAAHNHRISTFSCSAALALCLVSLAACNHKLADSGVMSVALGESSAVLPTFATTGKSFFGAVQCSPHGKNLNLAIAADSIKLKEYTASPVSSTWTIDVAQKSITLVTTSYSPLANQQETFIAPASGGDQSAYEAQLNIVINDVDTLVNGNSSCLKATPELKEVSDYLRSLLANH